MNIRENKLKFLQIFSDLQ